FALAASPQARSLRRLNLGGVGLTAAGVAALANAPHLADLRELSLWQDVLGDDGVRALASGGLVNLRSLTLIDVGATVAAWRGFFDGPIVARLSRLALRTPMDAGVVNELASSSRLTALRELSLCRTGLGPAGAQALATAGWLDGLISLDLS